MRRIFPAKNASSASSNDPVPAAGKQQHPVKKERSDLVSSRKDSFKQKTTGKAFTEKQQTSASFSSHYGVTKREHWCPSCPSGTERCETPPSGDENLSIVSVTTGDDSCDTEADSGKQGSISQTRLGLPEDCQDKQVLRPSINATSRSPSPEPLEWTSGLQAALDQLVVESRQELGRKYVSEPPSPAVSPPLFEKRSHGDQSKCSSRPRTTLNLDFQRLRQVEMEVSSGGRLSHPVNLEESDSAATVSDSLEFESSTSFGSHPKLTRSLSRSSNDGASILSNPRSHSFSEWSRGGRTSDNFSSSQEVSGDHSASRDRSHFKYLSARAVAERLAKAIRGNSKPKDAKDAKRLPPIPQTPSRSSESIGSHTTSKVVSRALVPVSQESRTSHQTFGSSNKLAAKMQIDKRPKAEIDRGRGKAESGQRKQEYEFFKRQLDSHSAQLNFVNENLSERVCTAEKLLTIVEADSKASHALQGDRNAGRLSSRELERQDALYRRVKKLQKEKNELAREVVSEVRLRNMERLTVREVVELMRRDMEFWIRSLEQDKSEMESRLQQFERKGDSVWFRDEVQKLADEKRWLEQELVAVTSKESALRQKVREFELQMQAHVARVEDAERTTLELRESLVTGQKRMIQLEEEGEQLRRKERENVDLRKLTGRLRQLCSDHEKSIRGLWESLRSLSHDKSDQKVAKLQQELLRLSEVEQSLRRDLEASRIEASGLKHELTSMSASSESDHMKLTLQEHINLLSSKLQESFDFQKKQQKEINALESAKIRLEGENEELQRKIAQGNDRQLEEKPCSAGQQQIVDGLQQSLSDMTHALNTQNSRIQRLSSRNEELFKLYTTKEKELLELREDSEKKKVREDEQKQAKDNLKYLRNELQVQQMQCKALREKVADKEVELEQCRGEMGDIAQSRRLLQEEVNRLRKHLENVTQRVTEVELEMKDREQKLGVVSAELRQSLQEVGRYREELPRVIRQRDGMKQEAEQLGREALRMSAEAEVLRRRVHELEEEVMLRDGHLSILRGSLNSNDDDC